MIQETTPTAPRGCFIPQSSKESRHVCASYALFDELKKTHCVNLRQTRLKAQDADWLPVWNGPGRDGHDGPQSWKVDSFKDGLEKLISHRSDVCLLPPALFSEYVTGIRGDTTRFLSERLEVSEPPVRNPFAPLWEVSARGFSCTNVFESVSLSQSGVLMLMWGLCDLENGVRYRIYVCWGLVRVCLGSQMVLF